MPSGGFSNQSFSGLVLDLKAGLLGSLWVQWTLTHRAAKEGKLSLQLEIYYLFFLHGLVEQIIFFIGTPKSDYTWASGPRSAVSDCYHRLKGTEWDPWEYWLMRSSRCKMVAVRDKITARGLRNHGVKALSLGNPMMDGISKRQCPDDFKRYRRLILLCGSRLPEAYQNFKKTFNCSSICSN